jgi:hypothetical protein
MSKPLIVGYFTEDTPYEGEAKVLEKSLETHGYEYNLEGVKNLGSWQRNTQYKAQYIADMLETYPGERLVYLDVDAIVVHPLTAIEELSDEVDIAAVHYAKTNELLSGTVYFSGSEACQDVVDKWLMLNIMYPEVIPAAAPGNVFGREMEAWDQRTLQMAINETPECLFEELPQEYTWIVELTDKYQKGLNPVIMHTRGAKKYKHKIDGKEGFA